MKAAPHVAYRYMLERLAKQGYLIVATPFDLSFDHLQTCDIIIARFERIAPTLARTYGALPVVGIGHSLGSLLHLLITSLFPDTPRAANALLGFNNKAVREAVPFLEEVRGKSLVDDMGIADHDQRNLPILLSLRCSYLLLCAQ